MPISKDPTKKGNLRIKFDVVFPSKQQNHEEPHKTQRWAQHHKSTLQISTLPSKYPNQRHVFLSGNHDLAFAAFVGVLPKPLDGSEFSVAWKEYEANEEREGWFKGDGYERIVFIFIYFLFFIFLGTTSHAFPPQWTALVDSTCL
ncbi:hypothetical protein PRUPE_3G199100 [Prunus persica]|uniref:Uncharacterized protein n=1 Tax=Prunus persica TaxID=3760 RepID=A0A251Q324_PRUPE|nr:hypothetical protein PRUPE_3G199100 [Prunus persica]